MLFFTTAPNEVKANKRLKVTDEPAIAYSTVVKPSSSVQKSVKFIFNLTMLGIHVLFLHSIEECCYLKISIRYKIVVFICFYAYSGMPFYFKRMYYIGYFFCFLWLINVIYDK